MFAARWSWIIPLLGAALIFCAVLLTTPPGFAAIGEVLFVAPRGPSADAAAYALAAAASLALVALLVLAAACGSLNLLVRKYWQQHP